MYDIICAICSSPFTSKRPTSKYCSDKCRTKNETMRRTEKERIKRGVILKKCMVCSIQFQANAYTPYQLYCSPKCLNRAMSKKAVESGRKKEQYHKHKNEYAELKSKTDLSYKDEIRFSGNKKHVLERDGHQCTKCAETKGLIVHHIDHSGSSEKPNNDMSNLTTLCRSCHMRHHTSGENSSSFIPLTKEQILRVRAESSSWAEVARKFSIDKTTLIRKRKQYGIF